MRLEKLSKMDAYYRGEGVWLRPYGDHEAAGHGSGDGTLDGDRIRGRLTWSNHPRKREDGVWCPNLTGYVTTDDGAQVLVEIQGYSVREDTKEVRRAVTVTARFQASDPKYRWLNFVIGAGEGRSSRATRISPTSTTGGSRFTPS